MKLNECLSGIDNKTYGKYDLLNLYESSELTIKQQITLAEMLRANKAPEEIHKYLYEAINPNDESIVASNLIKDFINYLKSKELYIDDWYTIDDDIIIVKIDNGDWKHEHQRFRYLAEEFFENRGYNIFIQSEEIGTSDSDTYSAEYSILFTKNNLSEDIDIYTNNKTGKEYIELEYENLPIEVYNGMTHVSGGGNIPDGGYNEPTTKIIKIDYIYTVDKNDIIDLVIDKVVNEMLTQEEYDANEEHIDEYLDNYINIHLDEILDRYQEDILDHYEKYAKEEAEQEYIG